MMTVRAARRVLLPLAIATLVTAAVAPAVGASAPRDGVAPNGQVAPAKNDNKPDPLSTKQADAQEAGLEAELNGKAPGKVKEVAKGQYVQLDAGRHRHDLDRPGRVQRLPAQQHRGARPHGQQHDPLGARLQQAHMDGLLYDRTPGANSMANYYSSSRPAATRSRVRRPTGSRAGQRSLTYDDNTQTPNVWLFLQDTVNGWYNEQIAAGKTPAQINAYLSQFDKTDRYDYNGNGNFNEPDGYIDTFQSVHSGEGEEAGGGALGRGHLEPQLVRLLQPDRPRRAGLQQVRRHPDRQQQLLGRQVHHPARERRGGRVHPRVRPRPRPAGPLRHLRRRERHRLLDADVLRLLDGRWHRSTSARSPATWAPGRSSSSAG